MSEVYVYDCNNYCRVKSETSINFMRDLIYEACKKDGIIRFYVFDGKNSNTYRREFYPKYKMTREMPKDNFFENLKWFKELLSFAPKSVGTIQLDGYEADDVIAQLGNWFPEITVFSTDKDLLQIKNAKLPMANNEWEDRDLIFTRKVLCGDPSDNISGVSGFGSGAWKNCSKQLAKRYVENGEKELFAESLPTRAKNAILSFPDEELEKLKKVIGFRKIEKPIEVNFGCDNIKEIEKQLTQYFI